MFDSSDDAKIFLGTLDTIFMTLYAGVYLIFYDSPRILVHVLLGMARGSYKPQKRSCFGHDWLWNNGILKINQLISRLAIFVRIVTLLVDVLFYYLLRVHLHSFRNFPRMWMAK